jgi:hypothetical protein
MLTFTDQELILLASFADRGADDLESDIENSDPGDYDEEDCNKRIAHVRQLIKRIDEEADHGND